jgi:transcriptional regulator with XRE-family HTH domain
MNISLRLLLLREYFGLGVENITRELGINIEEYKELENGKKRINGILAQKLSDLYRTPIEFFIIDDTPHYLRAEVMYTNCNFSGMGSNGYVNHQYNDRGIDEILFIKKEEIKNLKQQIAELKQQNAQLTDFLGEKGL